MDAGDLFEKRSTRSRFGLNFWAKVGGQSSANLAEVESVPQIALPQESEINEEVDMINALRNRKIKQWDLREQERIKKEQREKKQEEMMR